MFRKKNKVGERSSRRSLHLAQRLKRREEISKAIERPASQKRRRFSAGPSLSKIWHTAKGGIPAIGGIGLIAGTIWLLFFADGLKIQKIVYIENEETVNPPSFAAKLDAHRGDHFFFLTASKVRREVLEEKRNEIESLSLHKKLPGTLIVSYKTFPERLTIVARIENIERKFLVNGRGVVVEVDAESPELPYVRVGALERFPVEGDAIFDADLVEKISRAESLFEEKFGINVMEIAYKKIEREIHLRTQPGFLVWIDLTQSIDRQLFKLKRALSKLDLYKEDLAYIDLRISGQTGDKVIFKRK